MTKIKVNTKSFSSFEGKMELADGFVLTPPPEEDIRFMAFRDLVFRMFRWKWKAEPRWGPMEANQLSRVLKEMPFLTPDEFGKALYNLAISEDIPERQRPGYWLPRIDSYIVHPHNSYGRNPNASNFQSTAEKLAAANRTAFERAAEDRRRARLDGHENRTLDGHRENQSVARRPLGLPATGD